jgi:hypothetical protein
MEYGKPWNMSKVRQNISRFSGVVVCQKGKPNRFQEGSGYNERLGWLGIPRGVDISGNSSSPKIVFRRGAGPLSPPAAVVPSLPHRPSVGRHGPRGHGPRQARATDRTRRCAVP